MTDDHSPIPLPEGWREKVARIIWDAFAKNHGGPFDMRNDSLAMARVLNTTDAIAALSPAPEGWRVVPVEPTEAMLRNGEGRVDFMLPDTHDNTPEGRRAELRLAYKAMLSASPLPVGGGEE